MQSATQHTAAAALVRFRLCCSRVEKAASTRISTCFQDQLSICLLGRVPADIEAAFSNLEQQSRILASIADC